MLAPAATTLAPTDNALAPMALAIAPPGGGAAPIPSYYKIGPNGELVPDYSGTVPNWANSPMPAVVPGSVVAAGNPLIARQYPTDTASNVFGVLQTPLAAGTLQSFQIFADPAAAGLSFHAFVLRPTGVANEFLVVLDSGALTVPTVAVGAVQDFPIAGGVAVNAGDMLAWYGQGIPLDIGTGPDVIYYPSPAAPVQGATITVGDAVNFPLFVQARTYSFGATILDPSAGTLVGGIRKFVDRLPGLGPANANLLGQYIPVATPEEWCTRPEAPATGCVSADYYEIELGSTAPRCTRICRRRRCVATGRPTVTGTPFQYLGPLIIAQKGRPVRVKFTNNLPTGGAGNLFLPVDTTVMGSGPGSQR